MYARTVSFQDHFSGHASDYARYRPRYPAELFQFVSGLCAQRRRAWDCATGNGQAAIGLAPYVDEVIATDASAQQIASAAPCPGVSYRVAPAEASGLEPGSVDLITVAQALHWFDFEAFYREVRRVAAPRGLLAVWVYDLLRLGADLDPLIRHYHDEIVGPYWPAERRWVDDCYRSIPFPFEEMAVPAFEIRLSAPLAGLVGYLETWSAAKGYQRERGENPLGRIFPELTARWGPAELAREWVWPVWLRVGRLG